MSNRTIEAIIRLSAKLGPMAAFGQLGTKLTDVNNKAANFNRTQTMIAKGANTAALAMMRYVAPAALAYGAKAAVVEFANIERTLTRIGINADASREQMAGVYAELQQLAQATATPVENIVSGLDSLIASGKSLEEAMALIGSVSATAQAAGADFGQMATTADAVSNSFGIAGENMQSAFDILAMGGKAGKFELRDMAAELPSLAPAFAALGYEGEDGLKRLTAALQTVRMETGTSGEAATSFMDVLTKMNSVTVSNSFAKQFGIDIREEMEKAKAAGEDTLEAFIRLSKEAVNGDMSKLPLLFTDKQMLIGMRALMNHTGEMRDLFGELGSAAGTVAKDLARVTDDSQASIDRMTNAWDRFKTSLGEKVAPGVTTVLDKLVDNTDRKTAMDRQLEKEGKGFLAREAWYMANSPLFAGGDQSTAAYGSKAWQGGYRTDEDRKKIAGYAAYGDSRSAAPAFRMPSKTMPDVGPVITTRDNEVLAPTAPPQASGAIPLPAAKPDQTEMAIERRDAERRAINDDMRREGIGQTQDARMDNAGPREPVFARSDVSGEVYAQRVSQRDAERASMYALRSDPNGIADAIDEGAHQRSASPAPEVSSWKKFLLGDAAKPDFSFKEAMKIDAGMAAASIARGGKDAADAISHAAPPAAPSLEGVSELRALASKIDQAGARSGSDLAKGGEDAARAIAHAKPAAQPSQEGVSARPGEAVSEMQALLARLEQAGAQSGTDLAEGGNDAADAVKASSYDLAQGGKDAAEAVKASGDDIARGGQDAAAAIRDAGASVAAQIKAAVSSIPSIRISQGAAPSPPVSGNRGRTMPQAGQAGRAQ